MNNDTAHTFWGLINDYEIIIPPLQRDYAHGREKDPAIEQIRESLVQEVGESLVYNKPLVLNFIYGKNSSDKFWPIDGQQRLTTLFLLHWYVFSRADFTDGLRVLERFSYQTRDTSKRFCENICKERNILPCDNVSSQIKNHYWLTGNFLSDPTVKSMLVMLDTIHFKLKDIDDFTKLKDLLISENCPISFLWLSLENFQKTSDLYIKMNARGRLLSDFEIFKAKLQSSIIISKLLPSGATEKDRILYISKFNNQYAEFFYKLFSDKYDGAMMDFVKEMVRDSYLSYVSSCKVPQKEYRNDYNRIKQMNGSEFFKFIEQGGTGYNQCSDPKAAIEAGLKKVTALLDMFIKMPNTFCFTGNPRKEYLNEKKLFESNHQPDCGLVEDVIRFAIYDFLYKFDIPSTIDAQQGYNMWKRFIYNLVTNSDFAGRREDACEAFAFISTIVENIPICNEASIIDTIVTIDPNSGAAVLRLQMEEEILKAQLMKDQRWKDEILKAEDYFIDGQIGFILHYAMCNGSCDINKFEEYFEKLKEVFDGNKKLMPTIDKGSFEKAMLCMKDYSDNKTGHLQKQPNSTTSWGFKVGNYKEYLKNSKENKKRLILKDLIDKLLKSNDTTTETIKGVIDSVDSTKFDSKNKWKLPFILNNLFDVAMSDYTFQNCINLANDNEEVLLLAGTTVRAYSADMNIFLLYQELQSKKKSAQIYLSTTATLTDHTGFPLRYVKVDDAKIGYSYEQSDRATPYLIEQYGSISKKSLVDVKSWLHI